MPHHHGGFSWVYGNATALGHEGFLNIIVGDSSERCRRLLYAGSPDSEGSRYVVRQVGGEPALGFGQGHGLAVGIVLDLVAGEHVDGEVTRLGMGEVEPADGRRRPHGARLGELDAGLGLDVEQLPQGELLGMVGASRVAGGGADAAVLLGDQVVVGETFRRAIAPVDAGLPVQVLGEGFRQAIGQGLGEDGVVVVVVGLEGGDDRADSQAGGDGESSQVISASGVLRGDIVGEGSEVALPLSLPLLPER